MASDSEPSGSFQRELQLLSSFVQEQDKWLDSVLASLQWSKEGLLNLTGELPHLTQCPYNHNHFVPEASLSKHRLKCRYGVDHMTTEDEEEEEEEEEETEREGEGKESRGRGTPSVKISPSILEAVKKYAQEKESSTMKVDVSMQQQRRDFIPQSDVVVESRESQVTKEYFSTLESSVATPPDVLGQGPLHVIRYIKSWRLVPQDFVPITPGGLNPVEVKSWLFKSLPDKHAYRSSLGGEMQAVDMVMHSLIGHDAALTPDTLMRKLRPLFDLQTRPFVLRLWKFFHISSIQKQHMILDSVVDDLIPLPLSSLPFLNQGGEKKGEGGDLEAEGLAEKIQSIAAEETCPSSPLPTLPMESAFFFLSPEERRLVYDYVVEVGGPIPGSHSDDPNLYRDDAAAIKAKLKQQARAESEREMENAREEKRGREGKKSYLQLMKEERDYRRRRQKYRARNVHITRRTPAEVMRDIINARMQEIGGAVLAEGEREEKEEIEREEDGKITLTRNDTPQDSIRTTHASKTASSETDVSERRHERSDVGYPKLEKERSASGSLTEPGHRERSRSRERLRSRRSRSRERRGRRESERQYRGHSSDRDRRPDRSVSDRDRHHDRSGSKDREKSHERRKEKKKHRHRSRSKEREKREERSSRKQKHTRPQNSDKHL